MHFQSGQELSKFQSRTSLPAGIMAAALVAVKHNLGEGRKFIEVSEECPTEGIIKQGMLARQRITASGSGFAERHITMNARFIYFSKMGQSKVLDYIPLIEVIRVHCLVPLPANRSSSSANHGRRDLFKLHDVETPPLDVTPEMLTFMIQVSEHGHNSGRSCVLRAHSIPELNEWMQAIQQGVQRANDLQNQDEGQLSRVRRLTRQFYHSDPAQYAIGLVIMASYAASIAAAQMLPAPDSSEAAVLRSLEVTFTVIFAVELGVNVCSSILWDFVNDGWNVFDTIVVIISLIGLVLPALPAVNVLRLIRVFKMVRLFRKLTALRILINALSSSIIPVCYSFTILLLVSSIYAVIATELFTMDPQNFGTFLRSLYTLFQVRSLPTSLHALFQVRIHKS